MLFTQKEGRKEGRSGACGAELFVLLALAVETAPAQSWSVPFNHNAPHANNGVFTNPYSPWHGLTSSSAPAPGATFSSPSSVPANVTYVDAQSMLKSVFHVIGGTIAGWPQPEPLHNGRSFNAVHMAVIPKGNYRGHVLVWNDTRVGAAINPPTVPDLPMPTSATPIVVQSFQAYAIIDPADDPLRDIRFRNFVVPIGEPLMLPSAPPVVVTKNLFCAGHAWSQHGDLVVPGGTDWWEVGGIAYHGGRSVYVFNPRLPCEWPGTSIEYYPSDPASTPFGSPSSSDYVGLWVQGHDLIVPRWYPTATLTHRIQRPAVDPNTGIPVAGTANLERMVFLGGSEDVPAPPGDRANYTYEAFVVLAEADNQGLNPAKLEPDRANGPVPFALSSTELGKVWNGPGILPVLGNLKVDWLYEYPRTFLLSTGLLFFAGYAPRGAWLDQEVPGQWTQAGAQPGLPGTYSSNWQPIRHDGSAVLFPNLGSNPDVVLRLGGADDQGGATTATMESIAADNANNTWTPASSLPAEDNLPDGGRLFANTVILPSGALLIVGGQWQDGNGAEVPLYHPMLFEGGQWAKMPANPMPSRRTYHSTAVLLPDGRVFIGGGDDRDWDYEIFSPPYLNAPVVRPVSPAWQAPVPPPHPDFDMPELSYAQSYEIVCDPLPLGHAVAKAVLTAPCSVTHHSDMHQRYVELRTSVQGGNRVAFSLPLDEREAPRGIYMLWLVTNTGTPSEAVWVVLR